MKTLKQLQLLLLIILINFCSTTFNPVYANAVPVENKTSIKAKTQKRLKNKRFKKLKRLKRKMANSKKIKNTQGCYLHPLAVIFIIMGLVFLAGIALIIAGVILGLLTLWIPGIIIVAIILALVIALFASNGLI